MGNFIDTDANGTACLCNGRTGVLLNAPANTIGGTAAGASNVIAHQYNAFSIPNKSGQGILVRQVTGNAIERNSMFANEGLGIDLRHPLGVNPNDALTGSVPLLAAAESLPSAEACRAYQRRLAD